MHLVVVATGSCSRFRTVTILVEGVQGNQFNPRSFRQLSGPEDLHQKAPLLESKFRVILSCNERRLECQKKKVIENETVLCPKFCP